MENVYRIVIENESKKLEVESTDKAWVEKKIAELAKSINIFEKGLEKISQKKEIGKKTSEQKVDLSKMTINEFYRKFLTGIRTNTDRAVFFIYYLNWVENKKAITTNNVKDAFIKIRLPNANSLNYPDILARAKRRALLNCIDNVWSLTITGEDYVLNKIQNTNKD